jgi:hypothetical protein
MRHLKIIATLFIAFTAGCSSSFYDPNKSVVWHFETFGIAPPVSPAQFETCYHSGCAGQAAVSLTGEQWQQVRSVFLPAAETAADEREMIASAIGLMEQLVGPQSNTYADQACNNFREPIESFQLDCIAEATNSTVYLQLFQQEQLLRWHQLSYPARRVVLLLFLPHLSAAIKQNDTAELYVVDSWFTANGDDAVVVPLELWTKNYYPGPCR